MLRLGELAWKRRLFVTLEAIWNGGEVTNVVHKWHFEAKPRCLIEGISGFLVERREVDFGAR
jgi:hypothetical protein